MSREIVDGTPTLRHSSGGSGTTAAFSSVIVIALVSTCGVAIPGLGGLMYVAADGHYEYSAIVTNKALTGAYLWYIMYCLVGPSQPLLPTPRICR